MLASSQLENALSAVGELLEVRGVELGIVVVGGASLNLLGLVERTTSDVDVIAFGRRSAEGPGSSLSPPAPLPKALVESIATVSRDFGLPRDWMNTEIGAQWESGLPPWIAEDLTWNRYGSLDVGLCGRRTLLALKLFAAVDTGPESVHYQDLVALAPEKEELKSAAEWVSRQDASPEFQRMIDQVITHVREDIR